MNPTTIKSSQKSNSDAKKQDLWDAYNLQGSKIESFLLVASDADFSSYNATVHSDFIGSTLELWYKLRELAAELQGQERKNQNALLSYAGTLSEDEAERILKEIKQNKN